MISKDNRKNVFSKIFLDLVSTARGVKTCIPSDEYLENTLKDFIMMRLGYPVIREYENYVDGRTDTYYHFREVSRCFDMLLCNLDCKEFFNLGEAVSRYNDEYYKKLEDNKYAAIFLNNAYKLFSKDPNRVLIYNRGNSFRIDFMSKDDDDMPSLYIDDIEIFDKILESYVNTVKSSDSLFKNTLFAFGNPEEGISELFRWTLLNINVAETNNLEYYFSMYESFFRDSTFDKYKDTHVKIGEIFGDDLYLRVRKASLAYETPFYMNYMLADNRVNLPDVRIGIENDGNSRVAHILALQSSQAVVLNQENFDKINKEIKTCSPKSKNFRFHNPSHLFSLILTTGLLNGAGVKYMSFSEYLPFRYQRFVIEGNKDDSELHEFQRRMTNVFISTALRMLEFTDDIDISSLSENGQPLILHINDEVKFNDPFFDYIYNIGYNEGMSLRGNKVDEYQTFSSNIYQKK